MIKFILSSYKGKFQEQLNFISENAWMFQIKELCITDNFFHDWIDMKYYPSFLKKQENIVFRYVEDAENTIDVSGLNLDRIINYYIHDKTYYINFDDLINKLDDDLKYFVQLINRYDFKKLKTKEQKIIETAFIYIKVKNFYYFVVNELDHPILHNNIVENHLFSNKVIKRGNVYKILPGGFIIYFNNF